MDSEGTGGESNSRWGAMSAHGFGRIRDGLMGMMCSRMARSKQS